MRKRHLYRALASAVGLVVPCVAAAGTSYWDGDGFGAADGGSGVWDATSPRWTATPTGSTYAPANPLDDHTLGGGGGFVQVGTLASPLVQSQAVTFDADYTLLSATPASALEVASAMIDTGGHAVRSFASITGAAGLIKRGAGALTMLGGGGGGATFGTTVVDAGTLHLQTGSIGSLAGRGTVSFDRALTVGGDGTSTTFSGLLVAPSSATLTKTGAGQLILGGSLTSALSSMTVNHGTLRVENANAVSAGTTLFLNPLFNSSGGVIGAGALATGVPITVGGLASGATTNTQTPVSFNGNLTIDAAAGRSTHFRGLFNGSGNLIKTGAGTQQISGGTGAFVGSTIVREGTLIVSSSNNLGAATNGVTFDGGHAVERADRRPRDLPPAHRHRQRRHDAGAPAEHDDQYVGLRRCDHRRRAASQIRARLVAVQHRQRRLHRRGGRRRRADQLVHPERRAVRRGVDRDADRRDHPVAEQLGRRERHDRVRRRRNGQLRPRHAAQREP